MKKIAIDLGFGSIKVCYENNAGVRRYEKYISAVGKVGNSSIIQDTNAFVFNNQTYYLFDTALKLPNNQLMDLQSYNDLKEASPIIISYLLKKYGVDYDKIILGLSVAMIEQSGDYLNYLATNLSMSEDKFLLIPQGVGSKIAYSKFNIDLDDPTQFSNTKSKNFLGVDIGFNTIDIYQCIGGVCSGQTIKGFKGFGVCVVAFQLIDAIRAELGINITIQHAKEVLETGLLIHRGKTYSYRDKIDGFMKEYLSKVIDMLEENFKTAIDNMDNILFVGGGAALLYNYRDSINEIIAKYYSGDFIIIPKNPEYYNVVGYYFSI